MSLTVRSVFEACSLVLLISIEKAVILTLLLFLLLLAAFEGAGVISGGLGTVGDITGDTVGFSLGLFVVILFALLLVLLVLLLLVAFEEAGVIALGLFVGTEVIVVGDVDSASPAAVVGDVDGASVREIVGDVEECMNVTVSELPKSPPYPTWVEPSQSIYEPSPEKQQMPSPKLSKMVKVFSSVVMSQ